MCAALSWVSVLSGGLSAVLWLWAALAPIPEFIETPMKGPNSFTEALRHQARLNAWAAGAAAVSIGAQVIASALKVS